MKLYLNTVNQKVITVTLKKEGKEIDKLTDQNEFGSQVLLKMIGEILEKNKLNFKDLDEVEVETGPGSYTGLKVGVAVANAIGFSLNIPVNNKSLEADLVY